MGNSLLPNVAVGYVRVSHQDQVADGVSLARQEEQIRGYCKMRGLADPLIIRDEGMSGFKKSRPGFRQLIHLCNEKAAKIVIVSDLSRLSRSVRDTLAFVEDTIQKNGIEFVSISNDIDTTTPMGKAFLTISAAFNQLYRDEAAYKISRALQHKRAKGEKTGGHVPYGFELVDGIKLVPKPCEVSVVREMVKLRRQGKSLRAIGQCLTAKDIDTLKRDAINRMSGW